MLNDDGAGLGDNCIDKRRHTLSAAHDAGDGLLCGLGAGGADPILGPVGVALVQHRPHLLHPVAMGQVHRRNQRVEDEV